MCNLRAKPPRLRMFYCLGQPYIISLEKSILYGKSGVHAYAQARSGKIFVLIDNLICLSDVLIVVRIA